jgi:hypothetical protein
MVLAERSSLPEEEIIRAVEDRKLAHSAVSAK